MKSAIRLMTVVLLLAASSLAVAQTATSSLRGIVTDPAGALVVGATVTLESKETGFHLVHKTESDGSYQFQQVPPATYTLTIESPGFLDRGIGGAVAGVATSDPEHGPARCCLQHHRGSRPGRGRDHQHNQRGRRQRRRREDSRGAADGRQKRPRPAQPAAWRAVPWPRERNRIPTAVAARSPAPDRTRATSRSTDWTTTACWATRLPGCCAPSIDSVEEFKVTTSNNGADTGRSSGAQVNIVTRSGTNKLHGSLYEYNRNTAFSANDWFNKNGEAAEGLPNKPGELIRNTFGAAHRRPDQEETSSTTSLTSRCSARPRRQEESLIVPNAAFRTGSISYYYNNSSGGQSVETLSPAQFASLDPHCFGKWHLSLGTGSQSEYPARVSVLSVAQWQPCGRRAQHRLLYLGCAQPDQSVDQHRQDRLRDLRQAPPFRTGAIYKTTRILEPPQFPGQKPSYTIRDNTKGFAVGEIWTINQNLVNNARIGFTRQGTGKAGASEPTLGDARQRQ